jgi:hypothetical protein
VEKPSSFDSLSNVEKNIYIYIGGGASLVDQLFSLLKPNFSLDLSPDFCHGKSLAHNRLCATCAQPLTWVGPTWVGGSHPGE